MTSVEFSGVSAWYGEQQVLDDVTFTAAPRAITALIGPSGAGKSTLLRIVNRLHEESPGARLRGQVRVGGRDLYAHGIDPVAVRRTVGMVFQQPNPFPAMSVFENAVSGLRFRGPRRKSLERGIGERVLRLVGLWDEVADRLDKPASSLSGGQQQRLCLARAIAPEPDVLLLDEPCSALDPISTLSIERLLKRLADELTIIIVTHNLQQAARVSDETILLAADGAWGAGRVVEIAPTARLFTEPGETRTEAYLTGRL